MQDSLARLMALPVSAKVRTARFESPRRSDAVTPQKLRREIMD